jgi:CoA-dependent NAD(P)H sulfur oxidoreductase
MTRLVVLGGNAAGMSAASKAKRRGPDLEVVVLEASQDVSYSVCGTPFLVQQDIEDAADLRMLDEEGLQKRGITVRRGAKATAFNPYSKEVAFESKGGRDSIAYDKLLVATGSSAVVPFKAPPPKGVFALRRLEETVALEAFIKEERPKKAAVVGAGAVGLEMASAFAQRGLDVHLYEKGPRPLPMFDQDMTQGMPAWLEKKGVTLHVGTEVAELGEQGRGRLGSVVTKAGKEQRADLAVVAAGLQPNTQFAVKAGVHALNTGHILVDDHMRTNFHDVWAAGDCVAARHIVSGRPTPVPLALPSNRMGRIAGDSIAASLERIPGPSQTFTGVVGTFLTRLWDMGFAKTGLSEEEAKAERMDAVAVHVESTAKADYMPRPGRVNLKLVADRDSGKLLGAQLMGPGDSALRINAAALAVQVGMTARRLSEAETAYSPSFGPVWDPLVVAAAELAKACRK